VSGTATSNEFVACPADGRRREYDAFVD